MSPRMQAAGAETEEQVLSVAMEIHGNPNAVVDHPGLWERAMAREGVTRQQMGGLLGLSEPQICKVFSWNYRDHNVAMKRLSLRPTEARDWPDRVLLARINRAYASLVAEANGLIVGALSEEIEAARKLAEALRPFVARVR